VVIMGLAVVAVALTLHFRGKAPAPQSPQRHPSSLTLGKVLLAGNSRLDIESSADRFADEGTTLTDQAVVTGQHLPGRRAWVAPTSVTY
jgi:hypothetical protein